VCDLETSRMGAPYIYDISHLRVKIVDLSSMRFFLFHRRNKVQQGCQW